MLRIVDHVVKKTDILLNASYIVKRFIETGALLPMWTSKHERV